MSIQARAPVKTMREGPAAVKARPRGRPPSTPLEEFEQVYLRNVDVLMGYFARRCRDPYTVADLTSETFVRAVDGFARFDPRRGSDRAWLFGIAARVFARHCEQSAGGRDAVARLGGQRSSGRRSSSSTWRGSPRKRRRWPWASPVSHFESACPGRGPG